MRNVSYEQFLERYPIREPKSSITSTWPGDLTIEQDTAIVGTVNGNVVVAGGSQAIITGRITGSVEVRPDATVYLVGHIEGNLELNGNMCISGRVLDDVTGSAEACLAC